MAAAGTALSPRPPAALVRAAPPWVYALVAPLAVGLGLAGGRVLAEASPALRGDLALKLAIVAALPLPLALLGLLTTPRHGALRRALGEPVATWLRRTLWTAAGWTLLALLVPAGVLLSAAWHPGVMLDLGRGAALLAIALVLTAGFGTAFLLGAGRLVARGRSPAWSALAGGGAFGPAEAAPLLYAPAFALVAALVPPALLSAVWGGKPELVTPALAVGAVLVALAVALLTVRREVEATLPGLREALVAIEQAHATPFVAAEDLPQPAAWLVPGPPDPVLRLLGRAWTRRHPGSLAASVALVALALAVPGHVPGPLAVALLAGTVALYGAARALALEAEPVLAAARWLGASGPALRRAEVRLALGLSLPSLAVLALALTSGHLLAALGGWLAGTLAGAGLVAALGGQDSDAVAWLPRLAFGAYAAVLALATAGLGA